MTPIQWFDTHKGQAILVPGGGTGNDGQCEQAVDSFIHEVFGLPYVYTPNAKDFWLNFNGLGLDQHFIQIPYGQPILANDIIVYDTRVGSISGHIDVASRNGIITDFWAYDSNWGGIRNTQGYPILYEAHHTGVYNTYIYGYLRFKGANMPTEADVRSQFKVHYLPDPTPVQIQYYTTNSWGILNGDVLTYVENHRTLSAQAVDYGFKLGFNRAATADEVAYWTGRSPLEFMSAIYNTRTTGPTDGTVTTTPLVKGVIYEVK